MLKHFVFAFFLTLLAGSPAQALSWIEKNTGQAPNTYRYVVRTGDTTALIANTHVDLLLYGATEKTAAEASVDNNQFRSAAISEEETEQYSLHRVRLSFLGSNSNSTSPAGEGSKGLSHYFRGADRTKWVTNVPQYHEVRFEEIYPGIDVLYRLSAGQLEYDFIVSPGADPSLIKLNLEGVSSSHLAAEQWVSRTPLGEVVQSIPEVYQIADGVKNTIAGTFQADADGVVGFALGESDSTRALVIDPVIEFSGYFSGLRTEQTSSIAVAQNGNYILSGTTTSQFEAVNEPADLPPNVDVFVAEISASTGEPEWVTLLGGVGTERAYTMKVDGQGDIVLVGRTGSEDYPTSNAFQSEFLGNNTDSTSAFNSDGFVTKLSSDGSVLVFSTFFGGTDVQPTSEQNFGFEELSGLVIDADNNIYVSGQTASLDFPATTTTNGSACFELDAEPTNPIQGASTSDVVVAKFSPGGDRILSTCIGGSARDRARDILVTDDGSVLLAGHTQSSDFPTTAGAIQSQLLVENTFTPFVTKLAPDFEAVEWSTLIGDGFLQQIAVDSSGNVYGAASSYLGLSPTTPGAFQTVFSDDPNAGTDGEGFVFKLNANGTQLEYGTYLGAQGDEDLFSIIVDNEGRAIVAGMTSSPQFPLRNELPYVPDPTLVNTNTWFSSDGNNSIDRFTYQYDGSFRTYITLISRDGFNRAAIGDSATIGQVVPFDPLSDQYNTAAMAYREDFTANDESGFVLAANRDGVNQLFRFDPDAISFSFVANVGEQSTDSRAALTDLSGFVTNGQLAFLVANYGQQNSLIRFPGGQPEVFTETLVGRVDGNTTALADILIDNGTTFGSYTVVANEYQDIRLYSQSQAEPVVLDHPVGAISDMAVARLTSDGTFNDQLVIANKDRPVEVMFFNEPISTPTVVTLDETGTGNLSVALVDVNRDSHVDILVGRTEQDMLFINDGAGGFTRDPSYTGSMAPTKQVIDRLPGVSNTPRCPCFSVTDEWIQEINSGRPDVTVSVLSPTGAELEMSTRLTGNGQDELFSELEFTHGSDSEIVLSANTTGDQWPRINTSMSSSGGSDAVFMVLELDQDGDNALDGNDNCLNVPNSDQRDSNSDGFGNVCDADLNNDGIVNFADVSLFAAVFTMNDEDADFNGDSVVGFLDLVILRDSFLKPPGPGLSQIE